MQNNPCFQTITPSILYMGTPVALLTTLDQTGRPNIGPLSSVWALGWTVMLGLITTAQTYDNLIAQQQCVINFPSCDRFAQVEKIAHLTGRRPVPAHKRDRYQYTSDKFAAGGFSKIPSTTVQPPRIAECPLQLEATLKEVLSIPDDPVAGLPMAAVCVKVTAVHADKNILAGPNHIDPAKWKPLIYNFRHYQGTGPDLGKTFKAEI